MEHNGTANQKSENSSCAENDQEVRKKMILNRICQLLFSELFHIPVSQKTLTSKHSLSNTLFPTYGSVSCHRERIL